MASCGGGSRLLVVNGAPHTSDAPPVSTFLESISGAYTTTRTHGDASVVLFWERHLRRLADSARILAESRPDPLLGPGVLASSTKKIRSLVDESLRVGLRMAMEGRRVGGGGGSGGGAGEELAITAFVRGGGGEEEDAGVNGLDVYVHIGFYVPQVFGTGARLAVVGRGRDTPAAKHSEWVRTRKYMEKLRHPLATELLLSNDGDRILEGSVTNSFVVCRKEVKSNSGESLSDLENQPSVEVQTAPVSDGVLPGVIRQLIIEICSRRGIPLREVAPSWSDCELWEEAFITNSLRLLQHVEEIKAPTLWEDLHSKTWEEVSWVEKRFEGPGFITVELQKAIMEQASIDGYPLSSLL